MATWRLAPSQPSGCTCRPTQSARCPTPADRLQAGDKLVVLEVQSQLVCQTGFDEEPELHWKADRQAAMDPCRGLKHAFARIARECQDVVFLSLEASRRVRGLARGLRV